MNSLHSITQIMKENDDFIVIAHVSPDGDTLGCVLALSHMLKLLGKRVQMVCENRVPHIYEFLPGAPDILQPQDAQKARVAIALDCADADRLGAALPLFQAADITCNIDHHVTNTKYAAFNFVDGNAAATGELVYSCIATVGGVLDGIAASCLYAALMSDTGNFAYSNTTPDTLRIAAQLMEHGASNTEINRLIYRNLPFHKQKLLGQGLAKLALYEQGKVGFVSLTMEEIAACGATEEDTEGIIDHIRDIEGVELALLIRESQPGVYKISLRSKLYADVGAIAKRMSGGGHKMAAGYTAGGSLEDVAQAALSMAGDAVRT